MPDHDDHRNYLTADQFRNAAKSGELPDEPVVLKRATFKSIDPEKREIEFTISTADIDREGDSVSVNGWDLDNYRANPVVLWAHDHRSPPIGRSVEIGIRDAALRSVARFMTKDLSVFGDRIYRMLREGWMSACSVGFLPRKWHFAEEDGRKFGINFIEQELLEYSVVPIPAQANALVHARASGDYEVVEQWARSVLRMDEKELTLVVTAEEVAEFRRAWADAYKNGKFSLAPEEPVPSVPARNYALERQLVDFQEIR